MNFWYNILLNDQWTFVIIDMDLVFALPQKPISSQGLASVPSNHHVHDEGLVSALFETSHRSQMKH
jgi:hypothetical protein